MSQIHISENNLIIENKIFSASHFAREIHPDGVKRGTFRSYTVRFVERGSYGEGASSKRAKFVKLA